MSTVSAARILKGQRKNQSGEEESLSFELFPNIGLSKTYNTDKQVPDSAGTATAIFSGIKTKTGVLGLDDTAGINSGTTGELTTIIDWGQIVGKRTGVVTTTRITHATPAALYSHIYKRDWECDSKIPEQFKTSVKDIGRQLFENSPGNKLNVIMGGGSHILGSPDTPKIRTTPFFTGGAEDLCPRNDSRDLIQEWLGINPEFENKKYVKNTAQLMEIDTENVDNLLGIFAYNHMPFNTVRDKSMDGEPSLQQMTQKAISVLKRKNSNGFVLLVEGGRIDHGHHQNHAQLALDEVLEFEKAISEAYSSTNPEETLIIVTADHSHAMTFNGYPDRGNDILGFGNKKDIQPYETLTYANGPGFFDHRSNSTDPNSLRYGTWMKVEEMVSRDNINYRHLAAFPMKDETHGGEDVPVYATGPGSYLIRGVFEQSYIGYVMSYAGCMGPAADWNHNCNSVTLEKLSSRGNDLSVGIIGIFFYLFWFLCFVN